MKIGLFLFLAGASLYGAASIQPQQLRSEYRVNPTGIDVAGPRLSWVLRAADPKARGLHQRAFRVLVASSEQALAANTGDLWDSGRVESDQSIHVVYGGKPLASGAAAYWKVQAWDQDGQAGEWSQPAQWSTGLLEAADWHGKWIGRDESGVVKDPGSLYGALEGARWIWDTANAQSTAPAGDRYFRAALAIPAGRRVTRALLIAGADNSADIFLNGELVAGASNAVMPAAKDVTALIHSGDNLVAVHASHSGANRPAGLIGAVRVEFASGQPLVIQTGNQWRAADKVEAGWEKAGYLDAAWQPSKELGTYGIAPWGAAGFVAEHRLPARLLRKEFTVEKRVRRAMAYYSGLGLSELYLNGAKVGDHVLSPGLTDYDKHVL